MSNIKITNTHTYNNINKNNSDETPGVSSI